MNTEEPDESRTEGAANYELYIMRHGIAAARTATTLVDDAKRPLTPEQVDAKVARMSSLAYGNMVNPNDPDPLGIRPPNRIGYGRPKPLPRPG